ncbi:MAG: GNAT family N-acetyltransferase [Alistipes sp.]|nr:GNAT family N-acetyltransferase [Alistipes sp.]
MKNIRKCSESDYSDLVDIWERSVRSSHDFLSQADIAEIRSKLVAEYLPNVDLSCIEADGRITGFIGIANAKIEMLFIDSVFQGQGYGSMLMDYAINQGAMSVDVNEQNPKALEFYKSKGFHITGRDDTDDAGRPFPILHLSL